MTTWTLEAPLPVIDLPPGASIVFVAVDPATGAVVANVAWSSVVVYGVGNVYDVNAAARAPVFLLPASPSEADDDTFLGNLPRG